MSSLPTPACERLNKMTSVRAEWLQRMISILACCCHSLRTWCALEALRTWCSGFPIAPVARRRVSNEEWELRCYAVAANQGSPNLFSEGHIRCYTTVRGPDTFCNVTVSRYGTFYQINRFFINMLFFHYWKNVFATSWNGFVGRSLETPGVKGKIMCLLYSTVIATEKKYNADEHYTTYISQYDALAGDAREKDLN